MKKNSLILAGFIAIKFMLQYVLVSSEYDLHRDEYLHLDQANHLAWGYISVPPFSSWLAYLVKLAGNAVFWVKFVPALFGALTMFVGWKTVEALGGKTFALTCCALALLVSVILRINILFQPNSTDIFFWTLLYFTIVKYIQTKKNIWIYYAMFAFAFGMLSKYNIAFLMIGMIPAILLSEHQKIFLNKHLYFAAMLGLLIVLPNLLWQYNNHFPTLSQLKELSQTQLVHVKRLDFVKEQLLFFVSSIFIIVAGFVSLFTYRPFEKYRLFAWSFLLSFLVFVAMKAKGYYAIGLYPVFIAFGAVYLEYMLQHGWKRRLRPVAIGLVLVLSMPFFLIAFPIYGPADISEHNERYRALGMLTWEDGKEHNMPQDFADMTGWTDLAAIADSAYRQIREKENVLVLCDNYGQAGAINYYSTFKNINAVSFNADYINWMKLEREIKSVILVKEAGDEDSSCREERALFASVRLIGKNENMYARERGTAVYLLQSPRTNINELIRKEIVSRKAAHQ